MKEEQIKEMLNGIINNGEKWEYRWCTADGWSNWKEYKIGYEICDSYEYRKVIKREGPKYRPYNNIEELFKDWAEKTHSIPANMEKYVRPLIWVKKKCDGVYYEGLITIYYSDGEIKIGEQIFSLEELFYGFTFLDGSPCGIKE